MSEAGPPRSARCHFARCPACDLPVHQHPDVRGVPISMQPGTYPARLLPAQIHRHLSRGIVFLGADPREYGTVRIEHAEVCPARPQPAHAALADIWTHLAVRYRRENADCESANLPNLTGDSTRIARASTERARFTTNRYTRRPQAPSLPGMSDSEPVPYRTGDPDQDLMLHTLAGLPDGFHLITYTPDADLHAAPLAASADLHTAALAALPATEPHVDEPYGDLHNPKIAVAHATGTAAAAADVCGRTFRYDRTTSAWEITDVRGHTRTSSTSNTP